MNKNVAKEAVKNDARNEQAARPAGVKAKTRIKAGAYTTPKH